MDSDLSLGKNYPQYAVFLPLVPHGCLCGQFQNRSINGSAQNAEKNSGAAGEVSPPPIFVQLVAGEPATFGLRAKRARLTNIDHL